MVRKRNRGNRRAPSGETTVVPVATFKEPTSGLEYNIFTLETSRDVFTLETIKDVAKFEDTVSTLSRYVEKYRSS